MGIPFGASFAVGAPVGTHPRQRTLLPTQGLPRRRSTDASRVYAVAIQVFVRRANDAALVGSYLFSTDALSTDALSHALSTDALSKDELQRDADTVMIHQMCPPRNLQ